MNNKKTKNPNLSDHILQVSATMIGVCLTVIALLKVTYFHFKTYADEILGFDTLLFISSCFLSYTSVRVKYENKFEKFADILFFVGLLIMVVIGFLILRVE